MPISAPDAQDIARVTHTLVGTSLTADDSPVLREADIPSRQTGRQVAASFFSVFRVQASKGRTLVEADGPDALVISDRLWRAELAADPAILGRQLHLDGEVAIVVGVMPPRFDLDADFWRPMRPATLSAPRDDRRFTSFARLAPATSLADARAELAHVSTTLSTDYPQTNRGWVIFPTLLSRQHGQDSRGVFFLLQGAVAFVLLIACANIANLLLARATRREHEMGVRVALGASRGQLVRQLLTESLLLSAAGGLLGVALSMAGIRLARTIGGFPDAIDPTLNLTVVAFTAAVSILTGVLCGIVPALRASAADPERVLRDSGARAGDSRKGGRLRSALVVVQVAAAFLLATGGGLMLQTLSNRAHVDLGFNPAGAWRASVLLSGPRYTDPARVAAVIQDMVDRLEQRPSIASAGVSAFRVAGVGSQMTVTVPASGA
jgi:putative ABC transport system permease protein